MPRSLRKDCQPELPVQVKALMYDWLGLPEKKKRNSAGVYAPAVDRDSLEQLSQQYFIAEPFVRHILLSRDLHKQIVTLRTPLSPEGRYRTSLSIAGTKTGRLASSASDFADGNNLQNSDKRMKVIFIADPGKKFCNVDLEQADARNVGAMTWNLFPEYDGSLRLLDAAESGDLHTRVCRMCWTELPWTGNAKADREIADQKAYRNDSYRDLAKKLGHGTNFNGQPLLWPSTPRSLSTSSQTSNAVTSQPFLKSSTGLLGSSNSYTQGLPHHHLRAPPELPQAPLRQARSQRSLRLRPPVNDRRRDQPGYAPVL